jgi:hypothetical protein
VRRACLERDCPEVVESPDMRCPRHKALERERRKADIQPRSGRNQVRRDQDLRRRVLFTFGYRCVRCGSGHGLEVHHLNGIASDNRPGNVAPFCHGCHLLAEAELRELNAQAIAARRS